jgi:putative tryptophan/tyrosine transport system substrate-binding protein
VRRREFITLLGGAAAAWPLRAGAQQPAVIPRIGVIWPVPEQEEVFVRTFQEGLRNLGYVDGKTIKLEYRFAENYRQFGAIAAELVESHVDIIVTTTTGPALAAKDATKTIPIVFVYVADPVGLKLVDSLAHPGGNATGLSSMAFDLAAKQVEIVKKISPTFSRLAILVNPNYPQSIRTAQEMKAAEEQLKLTVDLFEVTTANDLAKTMGEIGQRRPDGLIITIDIMFFRERRQIAELALANSLPTMAWAREVAAAGTLMSYGANATDLYRRASLYVDKILRGAKPSELPVEQPTKFDLVINLKTAKALGLTVPPNLLVLADEVIE